MYSSIPNKGGTTAIYFELKLAKNGQNLAFLCSKSKNLQATMLLLGAPRVFGTRE